MIYRSPNGETHRVYLYTNFGMLTQGTETSKYLQERKSKETPLVVVSESGLGDVGLVMFGDERIVWKCKP